jgi:TetR/AcrR family transcriptional regulator, cholesterol catabolism regulator
MNSSQEIVVQADKLFRKFGVRSVSMDDISMQLGISKKTLYHQFENKEALIKQVLIRHNEQERLAIGSIKSESVDAIDEVFRITAHTVEMMRQVPLFLLNDLRKYYPECWLITQEFSQNHIFHETIENLKKGKAEGNYRADIDDEIIAALYVQSCFVLIQQEHFHSSKYDFEKILIAFVTYHLHGIMSESGRMKWQKYMSEYSFKPSQAFVP